MTAKRLAPSCWGGGAGSAGQRSGRAALYPACVSAPLSARAPTAAPKRASRISVSPRAAPRWTSKRERAGRGPHRRKRRGHGGFSGGHRMPMCWWPAVTPPFLFPEAIERPWLPPGEGTTPPPSPPLIRIPPRGEQLYDPGPAGSGGGLPWPPWREGACRAALTRDLPPPSGGGAQATATGSGPDFRVALRAADRQQLALLSQLRRGWCGAAVQPGVGYPHQPTASSSTPGHHRAPAPMVLPAPSSGGRQWWGKDAVIGPNFLVEDSTIGNGASSTPTLCPGSVLGTGWRSAPSPGSAPGSRLGARG